MQKTLGASALCAMLAAAGCSGSFEEMRAPFHASVAMAPSGTVTIANLVGEIHVQPSDANAVVVDATKYASNENELANIDIVARSVDGGVSVQTVYRGSHAGGVRYDVTVPRAASVAITNTTGTIKVGAIGGNVVLRTATGTVDARLGRVGANRLIDLKSTTGTVTLRLAADSSANVSASSAIGSISSDFPSIDMTRSNLVGANAAGRIGAGSATVRLAVATGSIAIDRD